MSQHSLVQMTFYAVLDANKTTPDIGLNGGCFLGIRGANGCGKTTLLKHLAGLGSAWPDLGIRRYWQGKLLSDPDQQFQAGMHWLGHRQGLNEILTIREEWAFWHKLYPGAPDSDCARIARQLGLESAMDNPIARLSAGERQKAAFGRLLLVPRQLWLLDEPDSHLDQTSRETLYRIINEHCAQGGMAIVASHQPELSRHATALYEMD